MAADLKKVPRNGALVLALVGELGSGKTTFTQGFSKGLGIKDRIISPTFIISRGYKIPKGMEESPFKYFFDVDLYRLEENVEKEVYNLGLVDEFKDPENIILIEWAEKIENLLPEGTIKLKFEGKEDKRKIEVENYE